MRPLAKVASGGEASRVMLALKAVLAESDEVETLIFDEIDTGRGRPHRLGGGGASRNGSRPPNKFFAFPTWPPSRGWGKAITKSSNLSKTAKPPVNVYRLTEEKRIEELAKMLGGEPVSELHVNTPRNYLRKCGLPGKLQSNLGRK